MAYTQPITWSNQPLTASDMNTYISDNLDALKNPPSASYTIDEASDLTTTSTSFVDTDNTNGKLSLTITTTGGDVMVHFHGVFSSSNNNGDPLIDFSVDNVRQGGNSGIVGTNLGVTGTDYAPLTFTRLVTGLSAGSHTFRIMWATVAGTLTLYRGAGTAGRDFIGQFWVREVS